MTTTPGVRRAVVAVSLAFALLGALLGFGADPASAETLEVPVSGTPVTGQPGTTVSLGSTPVPDHLQGRDCDFSIVVTNQGSEHAGNTLIVASGGRQLLVSGIEDTAGATKTGGGRLTLGAVVDVSVALGPKAPGSSVAVDISCTTSNGRPKPIKGDVEVRCEPDPIVTGATMTISGGETKNGVGFRPNTRVEVRIGHDEIVFTETDGDGLFSVDYEVELPAGDWGVTAFSPGAIGRTSCEVIDDDVTEDVPVIEADPITGERGSEVAVSGRLYGNGDTVTLTFEGEPLVLTGASVGTLGSDDGTVVTDADGNFTVTGTVPSLDDGPYQIAAVRGSGLEAESVGYAIDGPPDPDPPVITADPEMGERASTVTVTGRLYGDGDTVTLSFEGEPLALTDASLGELGTDPGTVVTDANGDFTVTGTVPGLDDGPYQIAAARGSGLEAESVGYTIDGPPPPLTPSVSIEPTGGACGSDVVLTGRDYAPGETVALTFGGEPFGHTATVGTLGDDQGMVVTDEGGNFSVIGEVPDLDEGSYLIEANRGTTPEADAIEFLITEECCFKILWWCWWWWLIILLLLLLLWLLLWLMCRYRYPFEADQPIKGTTWIAGTGKCRMENGRCVPDGDGGGCTDGCSCELFRRKMFRSDGCWEHVERKQERFFWCYRCACARPAGELLDQDIDEAEAPAENAADTGGENGADTGGENDEPASGT